MGVYSKYEAGGAALLRSIQDGKYANSGYIVHYSVPETRGSARKNVGELVGPKFHLLVCLTGSMPRKEQLVFVKHLAAT